jgi:hypothetical protein
MWGTEVYQVIFFKRKRTEVTVHVSNIGLAPNMALHHEKIVLTSVQFTWEKSVQFTWEKSVQFSSCICTAVEILNRPDNVDATISKPQSAGASQILT